MSQVEKSIYEESSENDSLTDSLSSQSTRIGLYTESNPRIRRLHIIRKQRTINTV